MNREEWLEKAVPRLNAILESADLKAVSIRVSVGWPARGALSTKTRRIGECWHSETIEQDTSHVFISPYIDDPITVLGTLLHEMTHASLPHKAGHKGTFAKACKAIGLQGKPTDTEVSKETSDPLRIELENILEYLGEYPHHKIDASNKLKTQTTRLRLYECKCDPSMKVRAASDNLHAKCEDCQEDFERVEK